MNSLKEGYNKIIKAWINNVSMSDIYHMIALWIQANKKTVTHPEILIILNNIEKRMINNDSLNNIVEDFVYGKKYEKLRDLIESSD